MKFPHRRAAGRRRAAGDQAAWSGPPRLADRSCCCPALPVVRVLIPPTSARPHPVDLLLCGHHYQAGRVALLAAGAAVYDERGALLAGVPAGRRSRLRRAAVAA